MKNSKIYFCGDIHGKNDSLKLEYFFADAGTKTTKNDFIIQLGDFGVIWKDLNDKPQKEMLEYLASQNITFCVVLGNHENYNEIEKLPIIEKFGGKVRILKLETGEIYFFERGEIYEIAGKKIFAFGGALSIDKEYRTLNQSYWNQELPNNEEYKNAIYNLEKHNCKIDMVVSHTCPKSIIHMLGEFELKIDDPLSGFFDHLLYDKNIQFKKWHFGHFHIDKNVKLHDETEFICYFNIIGKE